MKIPTKIKIGAYTYKVIFKDTIEHNGVKLNGFCENDLLQITIRKDLKGIEKQVVFMHECLHAIEFAYSIILGEKKVERLDHALIAFIKDNKLVF